MLEFRTPEKIIDAFLRSEKPLSKDFLIDAVGESLGEVDLNEPVFYVADCEDGNPDAVDYFEDCLAEARREDLQNVDVFSDIRKGIAGVLKKIGLNIKYFSKSLWQEKDVEWQAVHVFADIRRQIAEILKDFGFEVLVCDRDGKRIFEKGEDVYGNRVPYEKGRKLVQHISSKGTKPERANLPPYPKEFPYHPNVLNERVFMVSSTEEGCVVRNVYRVEPNLGKENLFTLADYAERTEIDVASVILGTRVKKRVKILLDAAVGLLYLHENDWADGDFKPENIFILADEDGGKKGSLHDFEGAFNISKIDGVVDFWCSPWWFFYDHYPNSPKGVDPRRLDLFAVAVSAMETITLKYPFTDFISSNGKPPEKYNPSDYFSDIRKELSKKGVSENTINILLRAAGNDVKDPISVSMLVDALCADFGFKRAKVNGFERIVQA